MVTLNHWATLQPLWTSCRFIITSCLSLSWVTDVKSWDASLSSCLRKADRVLTWLTCTKDADGSQECLVSFMLKAEGWGATWMFLIVCFSYKIWITSVHDHGCLDLNEGVSRTEPTSVCLEAAPRAMHGAFPCDSGSVLHEQKPWWTAMMILIKHNRFLCCGISQGSLCLSAVWFSKEM